MDYKQPEKPNTFFQIGKSIADALSQAGASVGPAVGGFISSVPGAVWGPVRGIPKMVEGTLGSLWTATTQLPSSAIKIMNELNRLGPTVEQTLAEMKRRGGDIIKSETLPVSKEKETEIKQGKALEKRLGLITKKPGEPTTLEGEAKPEFAELEKFLKEAEGPLKVITNTAATQIEESLKKEDQIIKDYEQQVRKHNENLDTIMTQLSKELESPVPKPPTKEDLTIPKEPLLGLVKALSPIVIGLIAMLRPGQYGENLYFFNYMYQAVLADDNRKFQEGLEKWQREMQVGLEEKKNRIQSLKLLIEREQLKGETDRTLTDLQLRAIDNELKRYENQYRTAEKALGKIQDSIVKLAEAMNKREELKLKAANVVSMIREREARIRHLSQGKTSKKSSEEEIEEILGRKLRPDERIGLKGKDTRNEVIRKLMDEIEKKQGGATVTKGTKTGTEEGEWYF